MNWAQREIAKVTNLEKKQGGLAQLLPGADVFIGVSAPNLVTTEMVKTMNKDAVVFACANPTPEIFPEEAKAGGAAVIATGRSDFPNQINNVLAFPGVFRGAFDVRASDINEEMKMAAAQALAERLEGVQVKIKARAGQGGKLFGSITSKEISEELKAQFGLDVGKSKIVLSDPIKSFGSFEVKCKLGSEVSGVIHVLAIEDK